MAKAKIPYSSDVADWFIDWLNMIPKEKYEVALTAYLDKMPKGDVAECIRMELEIIDEKISEKQSKGSSIKTKM